MASNWAIVIGINQYRFLQPLRYARRDAETMSEFLSREAGFDRIFLFTDDSPPIGGKPTEPFRANIRLILREIFENPFMGDGDNFWFFFSGHGIRHNNRDYLMPLDGDPRDVEDSGISTSYITERLRRCGADNVVMILDACRSQGIKSGEGLGRQTEEKARQMGVISIFSCSPDQYSYEIEAIQQGAFTKALIEGLGIRGKCATVERLNQYLENRVPEITRRHLSHDQQVPYTIAEPISRSHLILMPQHATLADITTLKNDAYNAEIAKNWELARRLWLGVLVAASGQDMDAVSAIERIGQERLGRSQPTASPSLNPTPSHPPVQPTPTPIPPKSVTSLKPSTTRTATPVSPRPIPLASQPSPSRQFTRQQFLKWGIPAGVGAVGVTIGANIGISYWTRSFSFQSPANPSLPPKLTTTTSPLNVQSFVEELEEGVMLEMVQIPGGKFKMGSLPTEAEHSYEEGPQHEVMVSEFAIGKYPVTQAQWRTVAALPAVNRNLNSTPAYFQGLNHPVEQISWLDAIEFCRRLSQKTGRSYRLPTEAEWEYACRAGTSTPYYFGETLTKELANYNSSATTPVASFQANAFGLHDMHGNVWECCADYWRRNYEGVPSDGSARGDPNLNYARVIRGGSWASNASQCRSAKRTWCVKSSTLNFVFERSEFGMRVACSM